MQQIAKLISEACGRPIDMSAIMNDSPLLENRELRDWMGFMMLRRTGGLPIIGFAKAHMRVVRKAMDHDRINALFSEARREDAALDDWFARRYVARYTVEDLGRYPEGSFGRRFHEHCVAMGLGLELAPDLPLETDFDYWAVRGLQIHDLEHMLNGGGFNVAGEMIPATARWASLFRYLGPELAGLLNTPTYLLFSALLANVLVYDSEVFPTMFDRMQRAWQIGQTSGPYWRSPIEDTFALSLAEAREALDIRNVDDVDTYAISAELDRRNASYAA
jgi:ubiquinone biosynthesis protein COQ4